MNGSYLGLFQKLQRNVGGGIEETPEKVSVKKANVPTDFPNPASAEVNCMILPLYQLVQRIHHKRR